jgi:flotillin
MLDLVLSPVPGLVALAVVVFVIGLKSRQTMVDGATTEQSGQRIVHGQGVFLTPFFQKAHKISLRSRAIEITAIAQDKNGITLTVDAVAIVKVGDDPAAIRAAAQRFLGQDKNIDSFAQEALSGSLRSSIGATDVMTIIQKRDELGVSVLATARESLANQGLDVDSFEIKGITDENDYIRDIGRAEQAKVRRQAEVAEHLATREAREAAIAAEQEATAQRRAQLRKAELESEVNAVADAEAYRVRVTATAAAEAAVTAATGDRDARVAAADAIRAEGEAQADAICARGAAEAEATRLSAQAVAEQSEALNQLRMIETLPQIARELAAPVGNIDQLTVISTDGRVAAVEERRLRFHRGGCGAELHDGRRDQGPPRRAPE